MKFLSGIFIFCMATFGGVRMAAAQSDSMAIKNFNGGSFSFQFFMSNWLLTGIGQKGSSMAGVINSFSPNVEDVFNNPAGTGLMKKAGLMLEGTPPLPISITSFIDIEKPVQEMEKEMITKGMSEYPADLDENLTSIKDVQAGQSGAFNTAGLAVPLKYVTLGFGYANTMDFQLKMLVSGLEITVELPPQPGVTTVRNAMAVDMLLNVEMNMHMSTMAVGGELYKGLAAGAALDRYAANLTIEAQAVPQGIVKTNSEFPMTDQTYRNRAGAYYQGDALGGRLGLTYQYKNIALDALVSLVPNLPLEGEMSVIQDTLSFIKGAQISLDGVDPSDPLASRGPVYNPTSNKLLLRMPSSFNFGFAFHNGRSGVALGYTKYWNEFGYKFLHTEQGLKFNHGIKLALDARYFKMGLGLITFKTTEAGYPAVTRSGSLADILRFSKWFDGLPDALHVIPSFTMGFAFPIGNSVNVNSVLFALPLQMFKTTVTYNWDMQAPVKRTKKIDPNDLFNDALNLHKTKKYWDAALAFGHLTAAFPSFSRNNEALFYVGESFFALQLWNGAQEAYTQMVQRYPTDKLMEQVMARMGEIYYRTGQTAKVKEQYALLKKDFPQSPVLSGLAYLAGQVEYQAKNYKGAIEYYREVATASESYSYAQYAWGLAALQVTEDHKEGLTHFKNVLLKEPADIVGRRLTEKTHVEIGYLLYEVVDYAGAGTEFKAVTDSTSPYFDDALLGLAWCAIKQQKYPEAAESLTKLVAKTQHGVLAHEAWLILGYCQSVQREYGQAIESYKKAIAESSRPTGIRRTQVAQLAKEKQARVETARQILNDKGQPALQLALQQDSPERRQQTVALFQTVVLAGTELDSARADLMNFTAAARALDQDEKILQEAQYALPTAEHFKMEKDKSKTVQEYEEKLQKLEQQMKEKLQKTDR